MENTTCEAYLNDHTTNRTYRCDLRSGHPGSHSDSTRQQVWPLEPTREYAGWFQQEYRHKVLGRWHEDPCVQFTVHELAELYVILSGNHDIPEVYLNKIGKALKEAL